MGRESVSEILSKVGEGKRWETIADLIQYCNDTCDALGPLCYLAGGAFGWKFSELIPMLEDRQDVTCPVLDERMAAGAIRSAS